MKHKEEKDTSDKLYSKAIDKLVDFNFDEKVANVFPDMINRSVPGYASIVAMTGILSAEFYQPSSRCYDLGCSLGASALSISQSIEDDSKQIIAVDNSPAMLKKAQQLLEKSDNQSHAIELICDNILNINITNASIVVMNFTLQFIAPEKRSILLKNIYQGMKKGGILILSEKLSFDDKDQQELLIDLHHFFKKANGYSQLEISQKRQTLENVLIPETLDQHKERLAQAGFRQMEQWFQCFNFVSLLAIK